MSDFFSTGVLLRRKGLLKILGFFHFPIKILMEAFSAGALERLIKKIDFFFSSEIQHAIATDKYLGGWLMFFKP